MHGNKQEQEEHDNVRQPEGKVYNTSDIKNEKSDKRQEQVRKDMPNAQNCVVRQTAQQQVIQPAEETIKKGSSRSHSV